MLRGKHNPKFARSIINQLTKFAAFLIDDELYKVAKVRQNRVLRVAPRFFGDSPRIVVSRWWSDVARTRACGAAGKKAAVPECHGNRLEFA